MFRRILVSTVLAALALPAMAQDKPKEKDKSSDSKDTSSRHDRGSDRSSGNFDPAAMRERYSNYIKDQLGANDEEWKVIQPKLDKVMTARRDTSGFGGFGSWRGRDSGSSSTEQKSAVQTASKELRDTLDNKDAKPEDIKAKLTALREAKEKSKGELATAQKELKEILTQRQEAQMVILGMLD